jgi:hypothetical protein
VAQAKELMAIGYVLVQRELPLLLALATSGRLDTAGLVTRQLGLADGVDA